MPNYVANIVRMKGIAKRPLFTKRDDERYFDFNKIIPMPESLDIECGSTQDESIMYYLTDRCTVPVNCLNQNAEKELYATVDIYSENWAQKVFIRTQEIAYKATKAEKDKLFNNGKMYIENYRNYGVTTWYDWCIKNWGVKWNTCSNKQVNDNTITFQTAWSAPLPVIKKLSEMYPNAIVSIMYADEDEGYNTGYFVFMNGEIIEGKENEDNSDEAYETYEECWDYVCE